MRKVRTLFPSPRSSRKTPRRPSLFCLSYGVYRFPPPGPDVVLIRPAVGEPLRLLSFFFFLEKLNKNNDITFRREGAGSKGGNYPPWLAFLQPGKYNVAAVTRCRFGVPKDISYMKLPEILESSSEASKLLPVTLPHKIKYITYHFCCRLDNLHTKIISCMYFFLMLAATL